MGLPLLAACGDDDEKTPTPTKTTEKPTTPPPTTQGPTTQPPPTTTPPVAGPTWVHNVSYQDEKTVWTTKVTKEETIDGVACFVGATSFDVNPFRYAPNGTPIKMFDTTQWLSKATLDMKKSLSNTEALGMIKLKAEQTASYAAAKHGQPYAFGASAAYDLFVHLEPSTLAPDYTDTIEAEVVAVENVTVPAGTFRCYRVEVTRTGSSDKAKVNPQLLRTEWWSAEYNLLAPVKLVEVAQWDKPETRELASYKPMPAKNQKVPALTSKPAPTTPPPTTVPPTTVPPTTVPPTTVPPTTVPPTTAPPTTVPPTTVPPTTTPPTPTVASCVGVSWVYAVGYDTENTVWTMTATSKETINGVETYKTEVTYDTKPTRRQFVAQLGDYAKSVFNKETVWRSEATREPVKKYSETRSLDAFDVKTTTTIAYTGAYGAPLSQGRSWSYAENAVPSMGGPVTSNWTVTVAGMEEVTVDAGTFNCYKVVHTKEGKTKTEWWDAEGKLCVPVKVVDGATYEKTETRVLKSYTPA